MNVCLGLTINDIYAPDLNRQEGIQTKCKYDKMQTDTMQKNDKMQVGQNAKPTYCKFNKMQIQQNANETKWRKVGQWHIRRKMHL